MGYGRRFEQRINRVIEQETKRFWESKLKTRKADSMRARVAIPQKYGRRVGNHFGKVESTSSSMEANMNKQHPQRIGSHSSGLSKKDGSKPKS
jgi:hypothetical protein